MFFNYRSIVVNLAIISGAIFSFSQMSYLSGYQFWVKRASIGSLNLQRAKLLKF